MSLHHELAAGVYWVGQLDWNFRYAHGFSTDRGSSYNAYLIVDEKAALIDTVEAPFAEALLRDVAEIVPLDQLDYLVSLHVEPDHSGGVPAVLAACPNAKLVTSTPAGIKGLRAHYGPLEAVTVKTGDSLPLGRRGLHFVQTPMLHWPDNMAAFLPEEGILFSSDAFGQHYASSLRFDDQAPKERLFAEAAKYYANIVLPFGGPALKALEAIKPLNPRVIAPAHGVVWRSYLPEIFAKYEDWANHRDNGSAVVVYDTMWGATERMARAAAAAFMDRGVPVEVMGLQRNTVADVMALVMEAKYVAVGSSTQNTGVLPPMAAFLSYLKGLAPKNKTGFAFGSYGWSGQSPGLIQELMQELGWTLPWEPFRQLYAPTDEVLETLKQALIEKI